VCGQRIGKRPDVVEIEIDLLPSQNAEGGQRKPDCEQEIASKVSERHFTIPIQVLLNM
jgi:hypothetical protein